MLKIVFAVVLAVHGLIHLLGFAKAFGAKVPGLSQPVSRGRGVVWLLACVALLSTAALLFAPWRGWPAVGLFAVLLSQALILGAWRDARAGTLANVLALVVCALGAWELRPSSFSSTYEREVSERLARREVVTPVTEAELQPLPPQVQTYLKRVGVVGLPHVKDYQVRFKGRFRQSKDGAWMPLTAEQHSFAGPPERFFLMRASMFGLPIEGFHRFASGESTMQIRLASLIDVGDARGPKMNQSESVTLFNDICAFAPATLIGAPVDWRELDARTVEGCFHHLGNRVCAQLFFDEQGDLVNFISHDRYQSRDGSTYQSFGWETPLSQYEKIGPVRLARRGDARWMEPEGTWTYGEFEIDALKYGP